MIDIFLDDIHQGQRHEYFQLFEQIAKILRRPAGQRQQTGQDHDAWKNGKDEVKRHGSGGFGTIVSVNGFSRISEDLPHILLGPFKQSALQNSRDYSPKHSITAS